MKIKKWEDVEMFLDRMNWEILDEKGNKKVAGEVLYGLSSGKRKEEIYICEITREEDGYSLHRKIYPNCERLWVYGKDCVYLCAVKDGKVYPLKKNIV